MFKLFISDCFAASSKKMLDSFRVSNFNNEYTSCSRMAKMGEISSVHIWWGGF
jgi:hypothetical protein